jgi:APA family basic amino acid/polyamine antiporter
MFVVIGLPKVDFSIFTSGEIPFFTNGLVGFLRATALLTFATAGAVVIGEMGGEMKNPGRDIPIAIFASTTVIGILYAVVSIVAVGILPLEQTAFQPLTNVAKTILPSGLFIVFIVFGAMAALATTLNATFSWVTKGLMIACHDGWLPESFGEVNEKYGTPHKILTFFYIVGLIPIFTGMSLEFISSVGNAAIQTANILPIIAAGYLPYKYAAQYAKSPFKVPKGVLRILVVCGVMLQLIQAYFLLSDKPASVFVAFGIYIAIVLLYIRFGKSQESIEFQREF